uniref:Glucuronosyltransferase n=1 Tax=Panagrolaimus sp. ES5 TaxID=591445 RepID=A0AC34F3V2_9BILA
MKFYTFIFFVIFFFQTVENAKILIYNPKNKYTPSHIRFMAKLGDILYENGHDVTVYQPDHDGFSKTEPKKAPTYTRLNKQKPEYPKTEELFIQHVWKERANDLGITARSLEFIDEVIVDACKNQLDDVEALEYLKSQNFDLGIAESFDNCGFGILHIIGLKKIISIFTMPFPDSLSTTLGLPQSDSFVPSLIGGTDVEMGIWGRLKNLYRLWYTDRMKIYGVDNVEKLIQNKFDPNYKTNDIIAKSQFIFINSEEHLDFPRPITHKIIYIGGFSLEEKKHEKCTDLENVLNDAKEGFIFVSFGSVAQSSQMPWQMKEEILETFKRFPNIKFLWKYENETDKIADGLLNVITKPWFNQPAIIDHPKLICFITHGGMNSMVELSYKGVPAIIVPLFADQYRNAHLLKFRKTGLILLKHEIVADKLSEKILKMINDKSFKENALKLSKLINRKPFSAKERLLKYVEFAAENEDFDNFDLYGRHLSLSEYYDLDIYGIIIAVLLAVLFVFLKLCLALFRYLKRDSSKKVKRN